MEQIFVVEPKEEIFSTRGKIIRLISFAITNTPLIIWFFTKTYPKITQCIEDVNKDGLVKLYSSSVVRNFFTNIVIPGAITFALTSLADKLIRTTRKDNKGFSNFKNLIVTSQNNKKLIPPEYHQLFEQIYKKYSESASEADLKIDASEALPKLKKSVYEHFSDKYKHKLTKKNIPTWAKWAVISLAIAGTLKLIASTAKDGFDLAEKIDSLKKPDNKIQDPQNQTLRDIDNKVGNINDTLSDLLKNNQNNLNQMENTDLQQPQNVIENKKPKIRNKRSDSIDKNLDFMTNNLIEKDKN